MAIKLSDSIRERLLESGSPMKAMRKLIQNGTLTVYDGVKPDGPDQAYDQNSHQKVLLTLKNLKFSTVSRLPYIRLKKPIRAIAECDGFASWFRVTGKGTQGDTTAIFDGKVGDGGGICLSNKSVYKGEEISIGSIKISISL